MIGYAIHYARDGYPATPGVVATVNTVSQLFREPWPTSFDAWTPGGRLPHVGDTLTNSTLANTFERLVQCGSAADSRERRIDLARHEWSEGFVAKAIVRACAKSHWNSDGGVQPGLLTEADLASFRATYESTISTEFRGVTVHKVGPWSQGPALLQILGMLADDPDEALDPSTAAGAHVIVEAIKLAMADRDRFLGSADAPLDALLSPEYLASRRGIIGPEASLQFRPGYLGFGSTYIPPLVETVKASAAHEASLQEHLARLRSTLESGGNTDDSVQSLKEAYPALASEPSFLNLQQEMSATETRIALARAYYSEIASFFNARTQVIPDRWVCKILPGLSRFELQPAQ
jgi:gamma-glutamyltranspeptidase